MPFLVWRTWLRGKCQPCLNITANQHAVIVEPQRCLCPVTTETLGVMAKEIRRVAICRGTRVTATPLFRCLRYNSYLVQYDQRALEMSGELLIWLSLMSEAVSACRTGLCAWTAHLKGQGRSNQLPLPHQMGFGSPPLYSHNALFLSLPWH